MGTFGAPGKAQVQKSVGECLKPKFCCAQAHIFRAPSVQVQCLREDRVQGAAHAAGDAGGFSSAGLVWSAASNHRRCRPSLDETVWQAQTVQRSSTSKHASTEGPGQ